MGCRHDVGWFRPDLPPITSEANRGIGSANMKRALYTLDDCHIVATDNNAAIGLIHLIIPCDGSRRKGVDFLPVSVVLGMCWYPLYLISPLIESIFTMPRGNRIKIKNALFQSVEYQTLELRVVSSSYLLGTTVTESLHTIPEGNCNRYL